MAVIVTRITQGISQTFNGLNTGGIQLPEFDLDSLGKPPSKDSGGVGVGIRKFVDVEKDGKSPVALEAIGRVQQLYAIESRIRGKPAGQRLQIRQAESVNLYSRSLVRR